MARKILIVDDVALNRQILKHSLEKEYDIIEAENGKEALDLMHRNYKVLSAVLLDIIMPVLDGYEVLRRRRDNVSLSQIPVIVITGTGDADGRVKALSLGANDFISKPYSTEIVRHCLRNNITLRETASIINAIQRDKLTGLYTREAFFDKAAAMLKDAPAGYYIMSCFDINNFKMINDQYGAVEGDRVLKFVGKAVLEDMEEFNGIGCRISADNFAVLFPSSREDRTFLESMKNRADIPEVLNVSTAFSVGRYIVTDLNLSAAALYDRAYLAKQSVKGRYDKHLAYFNEAMRDRLISEQHITAEMDNALKEGQFEVWFQPQYNHSTRTLIGAEALARWRHPKNGLISPGAFIPVFEQNGFIYEVDKYIWEEVCKYLRKWIDEGKNPLPVSVNISRYDIFRADFIKVIRQLVERYGIPVGLLRLEITESAFAKSTAQIVEAVKELVSYGFTVEIDDFGSGYSSLNTLKNVPAQILKLDMRFLEDNRDSERGGNILESIVRMTKWLRMAVIAEGVETLEQANFLKSIGCLSIQGYLYAKPMPVAEYEALCSGIVKGKELVSMETVNNLDSNTFWDPKSMDTLIFNSFVGSACIFEFYNGEFELLRVNDKFIEAFGNGNATVDSVLKLDWMPCLSADGQEQLSNAVSTSARTGCEVTGEYVFEDVPGCDRELYLRSTMRVIASSGKRYLVYCTSENITAQRLAEERERKVAEQMQAVMDNVDIGIIAIAVSDGRTDFIFSNNRFYEILGYTRDEYITEIKDGYSIVHPEDKPKIIKLTEEITKSGETGLIEYRIKKRDGSEAWLRTAVKVGRFSGIDGLVRLSTYTDITKEKHAESILCDKDGQKHLLDALPCGTAHFNFDGKSLTVVHLNERYKELTGRSSDSIKNDAPLLAIHPDDHSAVISELEHAIGEKRNGACDLRIISDKGEYRAFHTVARTVAKNNGAYSVCVTCTPVSNQSLTAKQMLPIALEAIMASQTDFVFVKDKSLHYICCNRAFAQLAGLKNEKEIVGKTDKELFPDEYADKYLADDNKLLGGRTSLLDYTEGILPKDGKERLVVTSKYLLYDRQENIIGLYGISRDITGTAENESQLRLLTDTIPGGLATYELTSRQSAKPVITYFNDGLCRLFGYTREEYDEISSASAVSLVFKEDLPRLTAQIKKCAKDAGVFDCAFRVHVKNGGYKWISLKAVTVERRRGLIRVNAVCFDITQSQDAMEKLRISEEENRLAIAHSGNVICRYNVASRSASILPEIAEKFGVSERIEDIPDAQVKSGIIAVESCDAYISFYNGIHEGKKTGSVVYREKFRDSWRWTEARHSTIFNSIGHPVSAVISFLDVTDKLEKEAAYKKWHQSLLERSDDTYSLYRCNISKKASFDKTEGSLLNIDFAPGEFDFDGRTAEYMSKCVVQEDIKVFGAFLNSNTLLANYYRGKRSDSLDYREKLPAGGFRWLRLTVDLLEYPDSRDVEAYLMFENIDATKCTELLTIERAETDPLTGILNRAAFVAKANEIMSGQPSGTIHALLIMDLDGFKKVNDVFGHGAGDRALIDVAKLLRSVLRRGDLVGRLGGDEFLVFMNDIPNENAVVEKAKRICKLTKRSFSLEVQISGSIGIAMSPGDGNDFETLYKKADSALYHEKGLGKGGFVFYRDSMEDEHLEPEPDITDSDGVCDNREKRRRMLIVDDNSIDHAVLTNLFKSDFIVEKAKDGGSALIRLRHYGSAISVVLLDLMMPGMDGFEVLEKMQESPELAQIPVIAVSGGEDRETCLRAIRNGATDFVTRPVNPDLLRIRVRSAISKAENERLRAKNSVLELGSEETVRYKTVLDRLGMFVIEHNWLTGGFAYDPSVTSHIIGIYNDRKLWQILLSDMVTDVLTVKRMQEFVHSIADDRKQTEGSIEVELKSVTGAKHPFRMTVYKIANEFQLTEKLIMTFIDLKQ